MCNLYSRTRVQQAVREFTRAMVDRAGNLPPQPGIFPDCLAPIVRNGPDGRELTTARWSMPSSQRAIFEAMQKRARALGAKGKPVDVPVLLRRESDTRTTNILNTASAHRRPWRGS